MIRILIVLMAVLAWSPGAQCAARPDHETMTVAAVAMDNGLDAAEVAGDWWRLHMPELAARVAAGEVTEDDAREQARRDLEQRAEAFDADEPLVFEESVYLGEYDPEAGAFELVAPFNEHYFMVTAADARELPRHYRVLVANMPLIGELPMAPEEAAAFREKRQRLPGAHRQRLEGRIHLSLVKFQNGRDFQAVITAMDLLPGAGGSERLHRFEASAEPAQIVRERLLSEGVTWEAIESHGFDYMAIRPMSIFPEGHPDLGACEAAGRHAGHATIRCRLTKRLDEFTVIQERLYVGGRLGRVTLHRNGEPGPGLRRAVFHSLRRVALPAPAKRGDEPVSWQYHHVGLKLNPAALADGADEDQTAFLEVEPVPFQELSSRGEAKDAEEAEETEPAS